MTDAQEAKRRVLEKHGRIIDGNGRRQYQLDQYKRRTRRRNRSIRGWPPIWKAWARSYMEASRKVEHKH